MEYDGWEDPNQAVLDEGDWYWDIQALQNDHAHDMWLETWEFCIPSCEWCWKACLHCFPQDNFCTYEGDVMLYARQRHGCEHFGPIIGDEILTDKVGIKECFGCAVQKRCHGFYNYFYEIKNEEREDK